MRYLRYIEDCPGHFQDTSIQDDEVRVDGFGWSWMVLDGLGWV